MAEFEFTQKIHQPCKTVWSYFTRLANHPQWLPGVSDARQLTPGALAGGSRYAQTRTLDNRTRTHEFEIKEFEPERRWVSVARSRGFVMTYAYDFEDAEGQTLVRLRVKLEPETFLGRLRLPLGVKAIQASDSQQLTGLKSAIGG